MPASRHGSRVGHQPAGRVVAAWLAVIVATVVALAAAEHTSHGRSIVGSIQHFLLFYMGVFALIALTAAVGVGLLATDRIVMRPAHRVVAQVVHRGVSLAAVTALATHIVLEVIAHRSKAIDAVIPFMAQRRTLYVGLGTVASDLLVLILVTGYLRGRFAARRPWAWRAIHVMAYLAWLLSVVHGLMAGRTAKPYVDWSYGASLAAVALALAIRFVATVRHHDEKVPHPVPDRVSAPAEGLIPGTSVTMAPIGQVPSRRPALPAGSALPADSPRPAGPLLAAESSVQDEDTPTGPMRTVPASAAPPADWPGVSRPGAGWPGAGVGRAGADQAAPQVPVTAQAAQATQAPRGAPGGAAAGEWVTPGDAPGAVIEAPSWPEPTEWDELDDLSESDDWDSPRRGDRTAPGDWVMPGDPAPPPDVPWPPGMGAPPGWAGSPGQPGRPGPPGWAPGGPQPLPGWAPAPDPAAPREPGAPDGEPGPGRAARPGWAARHNHAGVPDWAAPPDWPTSPGGAPQ